MTHGRSYPGMVTLPDGKITVFSGVTKLLKSTQMGQVRRTETFDPATETWSVNNVGDESETALPLFPRLNLMPNGKILFNGTGQNFGRTAPTPKRRPRTPEDVGPGHQEVGEPPSPSAGRAGSPPR